MAGRGPKPKDAETRARRNADEHPETLLRFERAAQPTLPKGVKWHPSTRAWWKTLKDSPQAEHFLATDWASLLITARLHNEVCNGAFGLASEVRLREAKIGMTAEDRLKLRMHFAPRVERSGQGPESRGRTSARTRRGGLVVVPPTDDGA